MTSLHQLYTTRLSNLSQLLTNLHTILGVDQTLSFLNDQKLIKYKIDRINQLTKQIVQSQKQKIIIQLMNQLQKNKHITDNKVEKQHEQYLKKIIAQKNKQVEDIKFQYKLMIKQKEEEKRSYNQLKQMYQRCKQKYKGVEDKHNRILQENRMEINQMQVRNKEILKQIKQLNKKYVQLQQEYSIIIKQNVNLKQLLQKHQNQHRSLLSKSKLYQYQTTNLKVQKVQSMKSQIKSLHNSLNQMKQMFTIIKQNIMKSLINSLKNIKIGLKELKEYIWRQISEVMNYCVSNVKYMLKDVGLRHGGEMESQGLMRKMDNLEGQLDIFIKNKLTA